MDSNRVEIKDNNGKAEIKIDYMSLKNISKYKIKRDTDIVELTFTIIISPKDFILNVE